MTTEQKIAKVNEVVAALIETAKANLERCAKTGADFAPVAFPIQFNGDQLGFDIMGLPGDRAERRQAVEEIHLNLEANNCEALIIINDAFSLEVPKGMEPQEAKRLRRMGLLKPKETIITLVVGKDMPARTIYNNYSRSGKAVVWEPQQECDQFESWMVPPQWQHNNSKGVA